METFKAFLMGEANRGKELMVFRVEREIEKTHESYVKAFLKEEKKRHDEVVIPTWEPPEVRHDPVQTHT